MSTLPSNVSKKQKMMVVCGAARKNSLHPPSNPFSKRDFFYPYNSFYFNTKPLKYLTECWFICVTHYRRRELCSVSNIVITFGNSRHNSYLILLRNLTSSTHHLRCLGENTVTTSPELSLFKFVHLCCFKVYRTLLSRVVYLCNWASWKL